MALTNAKVLGLIKTFGHADAAKQLIHDHGDVVGSNEKSLYQQLRRLKAPKRSKDSPEYIAWADTPFPNESSSIDNEVLSPIINLWNVGGCSLLQQPAASQDRGGRPSLRLSDNPTPNTITQIVDKICDKIMDYAYIYIYKF